VILWFLAAVITWINADISRTFSRVLSGFIVGSTATLIGYYVHGLPNNMWIPWKAHRNIMSVLYMLYALFFYSLSMIISQGSLFGIRLGTVLGPNPLFIILVCFLLSCYMTVGSVLDTVVLDTPRRAWLGLLAAIGIYVVVVGMIAEGTSVDLLFIISLAAFRLGTSLVFGRTLSRGLITDALLDC
jgi:hypothetical protein